MYNHWSGTSGGFALQLKREINQCVTMDGVLLLRQIVQSDATEVVVQSRASLNEWTRNFLQMLPEPSYQRD